MPLELYATATCPYCAEVRERLEADGADFVEYDVDADRGARERLYAFAGPNPLVPMLIENGRVVQTGAAGRGCYVRR